MRKSDSHIGHTIQSQINAAKQIAEINKKFISSKA
jgi:hypothetical protein